MEIIALSTVAKKQKCSCEFFWKTIDPCKVVLELGNTVSMIFVHLNDWLLRKNDIICLLLGNHLVNHEN